jgi:WD40 repeat protein
MGVVVLLAALAVITFSPYLRGNGQNELSNITSSITSNSKRLGSIPAGAPKFTPLNDTHPPVLHSNGWQQPVPMPGPINTAGAEDSPFITSDGNWFFFFFTPDIRIPAAQQLGDGVSGIWWSVRVGGSWSDPVKMSLGSNQSLDGCEFVQGQVMWFCSARAGNYRGVDIYTARYENGTWTGVRNAGRLLNQVYQIGELSITPDNKTMYYGSNGQIWAINQVAGNWTDPHEVPGLQVTAGENQPFVTPDGNQLWFTGESLLGYPGPALFASTWNGTGWVPPVEIVSQFAGEPVLDSAGNLYFVHHFLYANGSLAEADIYVAYHNSKSDSTGSPLSQSLLVSSALTFNGAMMVLRRGLGQSNSLRETSGKWN